MRRGGRRATSQRDDVEEALQHRTYLYDRQGDAHYDTISAFIKRLRGSDPDAALYWLARMIEAGEDPLFIVRRMVILASEDVGLADPQAMVVATACQQAVHFIGMPEGFYPLAETRPLPGPRAEEQQRRHRLRQGPRRRRGHPQRPGPPPPAQRRHRPDARLGYGAGYKYAHSESGHFARGATYLPEALGAAQYYVPGALGFEAAAAARLGSSGSCRTSAGQHDTGVPPTDED